MSDILLNQGASARRPANRWIWLAIGILIALAVWGFFTLTSRPGFDAASEESPAVEPTPVQPVAVVPAPQTAVPAPVPAPSVKPKPRSVAATATPNVDLYAEAVRLKSEDQYQAAREALETLVGKSPNARAEDLLGEINIGLVMSPRQMPEKTDYTVQPGDSLDKIAHKFGTSINLIMKGNNLSRSMVRINERLRIFTGSFAIRIDKSDNTLLVTLNDKFFKRYHVGTGQYNRTPVGQFSITDKIAQPTWWRSDGKAIPYGDPENLLGTHWLAIDVPGYGIHGTWETNTIGKQSSAGCIRLLNSDIEELYTLVPVGTKVTIED